MREDKKWRTVGEWAEAVSAASVDAGVTPWKRTTLGYKPSVVKQIAQMTLIASVHESRKRPYTLQREYAPSIQVQRALRVVRMLGQKLPTDVREAWAMNALKRLEEAR